MQLSGSSNPKIPEKLKRVLINPKGHQLKERGIIIRLSENEKVWVIFEKLVNFGQIQNPNSLEINQ